MTMPSISGTRPVNGIPASGRSHLNQEPYQRGGLPPEVPQDHSDAVAERLASAIAAALAQLGLTFGAPMAGPDSGVATSEASSAPGPLSPAASEQIKQYKNVASTFSALAHALSANAGGMPCASSASGSLTPVFESLWKTLGASSGIAGGGAAGAMPSLQSFLETLARHINESGITGLRGMFIDTMA